MSEFDLIDTFFAAVGSERADVVLGIGDDCALLQVPQGQCLAVSIDTLVAGVHFFADCDPEALGHKSLAVNLSDLAAMAAEPAWVTLALTLPGQDDAWLRAFSAGFAALAMEHGVRLVGGDTTHGPLSITVQVHGFVPAGQAPRRAGARPGDQVWVSGTLGDAGLALRRLQAGEPVSAPLRARLERPTPRLALGRGLRGIATAMIDISDGLSADLGHILAASGAGAEIRLGDLPMGTETAQVVCDTADWQLPLASGDDYELCFCALPEDADRIRELAHACACPVHCIGRIVAAPGLSLFDPQGVPRELSLRGYDHFSS